MRTKSNMSDHRALLREACHVRRLSESGIWCAYAVEHLLSGRRFVFKRMHFLQNEYDFSAMYAHRKHVMKSLARRLPAGVLQYHFVRTEDAWVDEREGCAYVVEPFVDGFAFDEPQFKSLIQRDVAEAKRLVLQTILLLKVIYQHGVVHGDAHAGNVMVVPQPEHERGLPGDHRVTLIDYDWCHTVDVPFSRALSAFLANMCRDYPPAMDRKEPLKEPCEEDDADYFCSRRAHALYRSGKEGGAPLPNLDLRVFLEDMCSRYACGDVDSDADAEFAHFLEELHRMGAHRQFDVVAVARELAAGQTAE